MYHVECFPYSSFLSTRYGMLKSKTSLYVKTKYRPNKRNKTGLPRVLPRGELRCATMESYR